MTNTIRSPFYAPQFYSQSIWTWAGTAPPTVLNLTPLYVAGAPWETSYQQDIWTWHPQSQPDVFSLKLYGSGSPWESFYQQDERWQFVPHRNPLPYLAKINLSAASKIVSQSRPTLSFVSNLTAILGHGVTQVKAPAFLGTYSSGTPSRSAFFVPVPAELQFWQPRPLPQPIILLPINVTISLSASAATIAKIQPPVNVVGNLSAQSIAIAESEASTSYNLKVTGSSKAIATSKAQPSGTTGIKAAGMLSTHLRATPSLIFNALALIGLGASQTKNSQAKLVVTANLKASSGFMGRMKSAAPRGVVGITAVLASNSMSAATATGVTVIAATSTVLSSARGTVKAVANVTSTLAAKVKASGQTSRNAALSAIARTVTIARSNIAGAAHMTAKAMTMSAGSGAIGNVLLILISARSSIKTSLRAAPVGKTLLSAKSSIAASLRGNQFGSILLSAKSKMQSALRISPFATGINLIATGTVKVAAAGHYTLGLIAIIARAKFVSNSQLGRTFVPEIDDPIPVEGGGGDNPVGGGPNEITGSP